MRKERGKGKRKEKSRNEKNDDKERLNGEK